MSVTSSGIPESQATVKSVADAARTDVKALHRRWARDHDPAAREALVERYQGLARSLATRYAPGSETIDDLVQVANIGLLGALDRFDPERGLAFRSFAVPTILGELRRHFRNTRWDVHMPRGIQERFVLVQRASEQLTGILGRLPTQADLADKLELTTEQIVEALSARDGFNALSLDRPLGDDDDGDERRALVDTIGEVEARYDLVAYRNALLGTMRALPERECESLLLRFSLDLTEAEIADRVGLSQMQVSRLLRRSLDRLRTVAAASESGMPR
jgi:RNA polymerase sigma-B factor